MGGDGLTGAVAGEVQGTEAVLGILPGGRGNDFARKLGIPFDPEPACDVLAAWQVRPVDVAEAGGCTYLGIASAGFDSDVQDIANSHAAATRRRRLRLLDARRAARLARRATGTSRSTARPTTSAGTRWPWPIRASSAAACSSSPTPRSTTASSTSCSPGPRRRRATCATSRGSSRASTSTSRTSSSCAARRSRFHADRPFAAYADGDPIADLPVTIRVLPRALKVLAP